MQLSLERELQARVDQLVDSGLYATPDELISQALKEFFQVRDVRESSIARFGAAIGRLDQEAPIAPSPSKPRLGPPQAAAPAAAPPVGDDAPGAAVPATLRRRRHRRRKPTPGTSPPPSSEPERGRVARAVPAPQDAVHETTGTGFGAAAV